MRLLKEIKDADLPSDESGLKFREASRAVLFDDAGLVPLLFVARHKYHKLPGGGIEGQEGRLAALIREVREEVGSEIHIKGEVGLIVEFRSRWSLKQVSYCYVGRVLSKGSPRFTEEEARSGFRLIWLPLAEAIAALEGDKPQDYEGKFIQQRDVCFLRAVRDAMSR
ncbi:MAG: NUDIX domain-containing protein [Nanoarchaeota archaeon]